MELRLIKNAEDHAEMLAEIDSLMAQRPERGTPLAHRLELVTKLVEDYERVAFPFELPDPLSAIRFRLEQRGLTESALVPYLGSRSRVSEVMSGKRGLSLAMIRALRDGLDIPSDSLLGGNIKTDTSSEEPDWSRLPVTEMLKRGWITMRDAASAYVTGLSGQFAYRAGITHRVGKNTDEYSLIAWTARVLRVAAETPTREFDTRLSEDFLRKVVALSTDQRGPLAAQALLAVHGIPMVVEPLLPRMGIDGCSFRLPDGRRGIALSLRHDRLDNFWFTLIHELAHVVRHLDKSETSVFIDDVEEKPSSNDELEADQCAEDCMVPPRVWERVRNTRSEKRLTQAAAEIGVHPSIIAGRIRYETENYRLFTGLIGQGQVRKWFQK